MATKTKIDAAVVRGVQTIDGWQEVTDFVVRPSGITVAGVTLGDTVAFTGTDGRKVVLPATAVLAVQTTADLAAEQAVRDAERTAKSAEATARGEAVFAFVHYADRQTFEAQVAKQGGTCASCGLGLDGMVHTHLDPDGLVRCPRCSVLKVRYGNQLPASR